MHVICTAKHSFRKVWAFFGAQKEVRLVKGIKRYQINFLFGIKKIYYLGSKKFFLAPEYQKSFVFVYFVHSWMGGLGSFGRALWVVWNRPNLTEAVIWRPGGAQTLRIVWLGDPEASEAYGSYNLTTRRRPNLTHTVIWSSRGTQTLRKLWFGDQEAPKPYAHYDLEIQMHQKLTEAMILRSISA